MHQIIKKKELLNIWNILHQFPTSDLYHPKFVYGISKNKKRMQSEIESLQELFKDEPTYIEYDRERVRMCQSMCDKDDKNAPIIINNSYQITEKKSEFNDAMDKLKEKYKDAIEKNEAKVKEIENILDEDIEIDFYLIDIGYFPNGISIDHMDYLSYLVNEE